MTLVLLLGLLAACGGEPNLTVVPVATPSVASVVATPSPVAAVASPSPNATAGPTSFTPRNVGGSIVIAGIGQAGRQLGTVPAFLRDALYDSLLKIDPANGALLPGLAESYQVSDDARTFTFHLRDGIQWHDGQPLTADDVVWTIKSFSNSGARYVPAADFGPIANVQAPDPRTVVVTFSQAYCPALTYIGTLKILPAHILKDKGLSSLANEQLIGSGPLVLKGWVNDTITLDRNPKYWNGPMPIEHWTYRLYATEADARAALNAGQADLWVDEQPSTGSVSTIPGYKTTSIAGNRFYGLAMNRDGGPLADAGLRQAVTLALDIKTLAQNAGGSGATLLATSLLPSFWAAPSGLPVSQANVDRARQILNAAGWRDENGDGIVEKNGKPLRLTLWAIAGDPLEEPLALSVREQLARAGIQSIVQLEERDGLLTRVFLHEYDLAVLPWNIPLDPDQHWYWQSSENKKGQALNITSYSNPTVDDLLARGQQAAKCDLSARRQVYADLYKTLAQDMPQVFFLAPPITISARLNVNGLAPSSFAGAYWNLNHWEIAP